MTGWTCPKCGRVYAPHVNECSACNAFAQPTYPSYPLWWYPWWGTVPPIEPWPQWYPYITCGASTATPDTYRVT